MADKDVNCRLRHGLNVHCLVHIFQYIDSADLYTVGEMNEYYKQIIGDFVIPKHEIQFYQLGHREITIQQVFARYGTKIRKFVFEDILFGNTVGQLVEYVIGYCSTHQLKSVTFNCLYRFQRINLPYHFWNVEQFAFHGHDLAIQPACLSVQFSDSLRYLHLQQVHLDPRFDWIQLQNITELYLDDVRGINVQNFIRFLCHRPKLTAFHHGGETFGVNIQDVCEAMAKYCGNQIEFYYGRMPIVPKGSRAPTQQLYSFISGFKKLKKVRLGTHQICGGDVIDALKRLAENDTIETLQFVYDGYGMDESPDMRCIFQKQPNLDGSDMSHFTHLKSIEIFGTTAPDNFHHAKVCEPYQLLNVYGSQILSKVERVTIKSVSKNWDFIKFATNLRRLELLGDLKKSNKSAGFLKHLESIIQKRNNGQIMDDSIELTLHGREALIVFSVVDGRCKDIKLKFVDDNKLIALDMFNQLNLN